MKKSLVILAAAVLAGTALLSACGQPTDAQKAYIEFRDACAKKPVPECSRLKTGDQ